MHAILYRAMLGYYLPNWRVEYAGNTVKGKCPTCLRHL